MYDYNSGAYSEITPRGDGGFDVYDYGLGENGEDDVDEEENLPDEDP